MSTEVLNSLSSLFFAIQVPKHHFNEKCGMHLDGGIKQLGGVLRGPGAFRLFLAFVVFLHHTTRIAVGTAAVYVFFVLSGYWIAIMWEAKYSRLQSPYTVFLLSRMWRVLPVFLLTNLIALCVHQALTGSAGLDLAGASLIQKVAAVFSNFLILGYSSSLLHPLGPAWSLDIELQFYIVAPLIVVWVAKPFGLIRAALVISLSLTSAIIFGDSLLFSYIVFFVIGALAAKTSWHPSRAWLQMSLLMLAVMIALLFATPIGRELLLGGSARTATHSRFNPLVNIFMAICVMPYAISTVYRQGCACDQMFADMSYIVYLLHWVGAVILGKYFGDLAPLQRIRPFACIWIAVVLGALAIWKFYDRPIDRMRQRFVNRAPSKRRSPRFDEGVQLSPASD